MQLEFTRKDYERIRKMDRGQMEAYIADRCKRSYEEGFEEGKKSGEENRWISSDKVIGLEEHLQGIRGIGASKARLVCREVLLFLGNIQEQ